MTRQPIRQKPGNGANGTLVYWRAQIPDVCAKEVEVRLARLRVAPDKLLEFLIQEMFLQRTIELARHEAGHAIIDRRDCVTVNTIELALDAGRVRARHPREALRSLKDTTGKGIAVRALCIQIIDQAVAGDVACWVLSDAISLGEWGEGTRDDQEIAYEFAVEILGTQASYATVRAFVNERRKEVFHYMSKSNIKGVLQKLATKVLEGDLLNASEIEDIVDPVVHPI